MPSPAAALTCFQQQKSRGLFSAVRTFHSSFRRFPSPPTAAKVCPASETSPRRHALRAPAVRGETPAPDPGPRTCGSRPQNPRRISAPHSSAPRSVPVGEAGLLNPDSHGRSSSPRSPARSAPTPAGPLGSPTRRLRSDGRRALIGRELADHWRHFHRLPKSCCSRPPSSVRPVPLEKDMLSGPFGYESKDSDHACSWECDGEGVPPCNC